MKTIINGGDVFMEEMKLIKVTPKVKSELDNLKLDKETYNLTIQRLILENKSLKDDKEKLMQIALNKS